MRRPVRAAWLASLLAVAFAAALWVLPARWAMAWIPEASPIQIVDATGTMWNATATVAMGVGGLRRTLPEPLRWQLAFNDGPHLVLQHPWMRGPLKLGVSWQGLRLSPQSLQLPASVLTTVHALFNTLDPGGEVVLTWPELFIRPGGRLASPGDAGLLTAQWRNAGSSLSRVQPMGAYTLGLAPGSSRNISLVLKTDAGPLQMDGAGTLTSSGRAQFDGKAWVDASASGDTTAALQGLLDALGPRAPDGHSILKIR